MGKFKHSMNDMIEKQVVYQAWSSTNSIPVYYDFIASWDPR